MLSHNSNMIVQSVRAMPSKLPTLVVTLLMVLSVIPFTLNENVNPNEDSLDQNSISATSEDAQWTSGYECPDEGRCSDAMSLGTNHNIWLEELRGPNSVSPFTATSAGAMTSATDASVIATENTDIIENYTNVRPFFVEFNQDLFEAHDVASMSTWELQKTRGIMMLDWDCTQWCADADTNTLVDEFTDLLNPAFEQVRGATEETGVDEADFESRLNAIFDSNAYKDASSDGQDMMLAFHAIYHASDYYWGETGDTTGRVGGNFWKKVGDGLAIVGGAAAGFLTGGPVGAVAGGCTAGAAAVGSFSNSDGGEDPGSGGGFSGDTTVCAEEWQSCIIDRVDSNGQPLLQEKSGTEDNTNLDEEEASEESGSALPGFSAMMVISVLFTAAILASRRQQL